MSLRELGKNKVNTLYQMHPAFSRIQAGIDETKVLIAQGLIRSQPKPETVEDLRQVEFNVFSQFGDDGIIQFLINNLDIAEKTFVEFGSAKYTEANTRFLTVNNNWSGLLIDGSSSNIEYIKRDPIYWQHDLKAVSAFITRDNINDLIGSNGFAGEIGLLSIDIDGNDYWVWQRIDVVKPIIVITEYNPVFGGRHAVSIPYAANFYRFNAHFSGLYWGASMRAFCYQAKERGFEFIGCNSAGNNAYFVRCDKIGPLKIQDPESGFRPGKWSDSRDSDGNLNWLRGGEKIAAIESLEVIDVTTGAKVQIRDLGIDS